MPRPIWITGAGGLIGNYLVQTAPGFLSDTTVVGLTRAHLNLVDFSEVRREFHHQKPQALIHCAALSQDADCRANPALAHRLNVGATALLAELAAEIPFVFFSTDLVFDGRQGNYDESASVNPLGLYGETKAVAEEIVLANPSHTVVRTSLNGGISPTGDRAFNERMRQAWQEGRLVTLFTDEFRCPIPAGVTAAAVWEMIGCNRPGLYHLAGRERLSRYQIGQLVAARWPKLNPKLKPDSLTRYAGVARPPDTSLNCAKVQGLLSFPLPGLGEWLTAHPQEVF